ncbi:NUDIX hydrolase [Porticoccus sp. GXU_MW_L64]
MSDCEPVPAVPSASLILLRDTDNGMQVLMARRNPRLRMAGDFWVFPGGALEDCDRQQAGGDELLSFRLNAVRETQEEVAIEVTPVDSLVYFSRWVAPDQMAMRFDTRFFAVRMPAEQIPQADGGELVELRWFYPADLVAGADSGELLVMFPTMMNARRLMEFDTVTDVLADAAGRVVEAVKPELSFRDGKGVAHVPVEVGFGITEYPIKTV